MVVSFRRDDTHKYTSIRHYHPQCWLDDAMDYLSRNPYTPHGNRGRPTKDLTPEQRVRRTKLLMAKAALEQQKRKVSSPEPHRTAILARIDSKMCGIMLEVAQVGGIPKSWIQKLIDQG